MQIKTKGKTCYLCERAIKPARTRAGITLTPGDEVYRIKPSKGAAFYVHTECYAKIPKRGDKICQK